MGGLGPDDGWSESEILAAEERLGFRIPAPLREFYGLLGRRDDLLRIQDPVLGPHDLYLDEEDILVVRHENQGSVLWGFPCGAGPDPEVMWKDRHSGSAARWRDYREPLSAFLLESVLEEAIFSGSVSTAYCSMDAIEFEAIESTFVSLDFPPHVYWPEPQGDPVKWYGGQGVFIRRGADTAWAMCRTEEAAETLLERVPGNWEWLDF